LASFPVPTSFPPPASSPLRRRWFPPLAFFSFPLSIYPPFSILSPFPVVVSMLFPLASFLSGSPTEVLALFLARFSSPTCGGLFPPRFFLWSRFVSFPGSLWLVVFRAEVSLPPWFPRQDLHCVLFVSTEPQNPIRCEGALFFLARHSPIPHPSFMVGVMNKTPPFPLVPPCDDPVTDMGAWHLMSFPSPVFTTFPSPWLPVLFEEPYFLLALCAPSWMGVPTGLPPIFCRTPPEGPPKQSE